VLFLFPLLYGKIFNYLEVLLFQVLGNFEVMLLICGISLELEVAYLFFNPKFNKTSSISLSSIKE